MRATALLLVVLLAAAATTPAGAEDEVDPLLHHLRGDPHGDQDVFFELTAAEMDNFVDEQASIDTCCTELTAWSSERGAVFCCRITRCQSLVL